MLLCGLVCGFWAGLWWAAWLRSLYEPEDVVVRPHARYWRRNGGP